MQGVEDIVIWVMLPEGTTKRDLSVCRASITDWNSSTQAGIIVSVAHNYSTLLWFDKTCHMTCNILSKYWFVFKKCQKGLMKVSICLFLVSGNCLCLQQPPASYNWAIRLSCISFESKKRILILLKRSDQGILVSDAPSSSSYFSAK